MGRGAAGSDQEAALGVDEAAPSTKASGASNDASRGESIRVVCRVRPTIARDSGSIIASSAPCPDGIHEAIKLGKDKQFAFNRVFMPEVEQNTVFREFIPLVDSCLEGYNSCVMAYGQTVSLRGLSFSVLLLRDRADVGLD